MGPAARCGLYLGILLQYHRRRHLNDSRSPTRNPRKRLCPCGGSQVAVGDWTQAGQYGDRGARHGWCPVLRRRGHHEDDSRPPAKSAKETRRLPYIRCLWVIPEPLASGFHAKRLMPSIPERPDAVPPRHLNINFETPGLPRPNSQSTVKIPWRPLGVYGEPLNLTERPFMEGPQRQVQACLSDPVQLLVADMRCRLPWPPRLEIPTKL
jgi:hypothetical protein